MAVYDSHSGSVRSEDRAEGKSTILFVEKIKNISNCNDL